jgi:hypothetical protein
MPTFDSGAQNHPNEFSDMKLMNALAAEGWGKTNDLRRRRNAGQD